MTLTYDYLHGTDIYLYQDDNMFRMNTDTALLAGFMKINKQDRVLDIGTNNGALLAAASRYAPSYLYGVEIQEKAAALARLNMQQLHLDHAQIICADIKDIDMPKVHVVLCNPPYFPDHKTMKKNETKSIRIARHEIHMSLTLLAQKASEALDEKGRLYLVHRANRLTDIISELRAHRLETKKIQFVYDDKKEEAITVLIEAMKDGKAGCRILPPMILHH